MNFIKGAFLGSFATATAVMLYKEMDKNTRSKMLKKGKNIAKAIRKW